MSTTVMSHYELLGVDRDATEEDVRKAFRRLAKSYHPDVNPTEAAAAMYLRLTEASDVLADPVRRADYNRSLDAPESTTEPTPEPVPESVADPDWGKEEAVDLTEEEADDVNFDVVAAPTDPARWARPPGEDALPSTAIQRRTWWRATAVIAVLMTGFCAFAVYGRTRPMPPDTSDWADASLMGTAYVTMAAATATFIRPLRKLIIAILLVAAAIATVVGWLAWNAGDVHLPLHPAILTWLGLALAVTLSRAWRMHKGRTHEEVGTDG